MDNEPPMSSQSVISALIVICVTVIGLAALLVGFFDKSNGAVAFGLAGTVIGGLLSALQPPGSLTNAIKNLVNPQVKP